MYAFPAYSHLNSHIAGLKRPALLMVVLLLAVAGCGDVNEPVRPTPTSTPSNLLPPTSTPVPPAADTSIRVDNLIFTPVRSTFVSDQPGLSQVELTLNVAADPVIPISFIEWGTRISFTEITVTPARRSPSGDLVKLVAELSWGGSGYLRLRPEPGVTSTEFTIVGGTSRSFTLGFQARVPTRSINDLRFSISEGTVDEHRAGQQRTVGAIPLTSASPPEQRLLEANPDASLQVTNATVDCRNGAAFVNGSMANPAGSQARVGDLELFLYGPQGLHIANWVINRSTAAQQVEGPPLGTNALIQPMQQLEFGFRVNATGDICNRAGLWALVQDRQLMGAGEIPAAP